MISAIFKLSENKQHLVISRRNFQGIDRPDYDEIDRLALPGVLVLIEILRGYAEEMKQVATVDINGQKMSLVQCLEWYNRIIPEAIQLEKILSNHGIDVSGIKESKHEQAR